MNHDEENRTLDETGYRSMTWKLTNNTLDNLVFNSSSFQHGRWDGTPLGRVPKGCSINYSVCSRDAALVGVEGTAIWHLEARTERTFGVRFYNPINGSNTFTVHVPEPEFTSRVVGSIGGNHAYFEVIFEKSSK